MQIIFMQNRILKRYPTAYQLEMDVVMCSSRGKHIEELRAAKKGPSSAAT